MTVYETLIYKALKCEEAARRAENEGFKRMWLFKSAQLREKARSLSVKKGGAIA